MTTDDKSTPEDQHQGEHTGKVRTIVHAEMETISDKLEHGEKLFKRVQTIGAAVVAIFLAGVGTIMFLSARFAAAQDVEKITAAQAAQSAAFNQHVITEAAKMGALEAQSANIENDYHAIREQMWRVADRVGARRVPEPYHSPVVTPVEGDHR